MQRILEDCNVEWAVHRLQVVLLFVHFQGGEHAFLIEIQVPAGLPKLGFADVGRVDDVVSQPVVEVLPVVLDQGTDPASLGMPDDQPRANLVMNAEQVQFAA